MALTKAELVKTMQEAAGKDVTRAAAERAYEALWDAIADELVKGESVSINKFGTFKVIETATREGRNPATGEKLTIPASKRPKFHASASLKAKIQ